MTQIILTSQIKTCMKTWLLCEAFLHTEADRNHPREYLLNECAECSQACFELVGYLVGEHKGSEDVGLACLIHCKQFAKLCAAYPNDRDIQACSRTCISCVEMIKEITNFSLN